MNDCDFTDDYRNSNWLSKVTYYWTNRLINHTRKHKKIDDKAKLIDMREEWDTINLSDNIDQRIQHEILNNPEFRAKNKMGRIIVKTFKKEIIFMVLIANFTDMLSILNVFLVSFFIGWLKDKNAENWQGYLYALLLIMITIIAGYLRNL